MLCKKIELFLYFLKSTGPMQDPSVFSVEEN